MQIIKRNKDREDFNPAKIYKRLQKASKGLSVDIDKVFIGIQNSLADNITTKQIDEIAAATAFSFVDSHADYSKLASNIAVSRHHKETADTFGEVLEILASHKDEYGVSKPLITNSLYIKYKEHSELIEDALKAHLKYEFDVDYYQWIRLSSSYLIKLAVPGNQSKIVERTNYMLMRVALTLTDTVEEAITLFKECLAGEKLFAYGSPVHMNAGTILNQMISCNLSTIKDDSQPGLLETHNNICKASAKGEGIGLHIHAIRSKKSTISSSGGRAGGVMKYLKMLNEGLRFFDQGGKRPSHAAIYIEPWHRDVFDVIDIRKNFGKDDERARELFPALWMPDLFFKRLKENSYWTLMCPNEILLYYKREGIVGKKPLYLMYGEEFEQEYIALENAALEGKLHQTSIQTAVSMWDKILRTQLDTGAPFILSKDSANRKSNQKNLGTLTGSNLCTEILEVVRPDMIATCTLASLLLKNMVNAKTKTFDYDKLAKAVKYVVITLNKVIDLNSYSTPEAEKGGKSQRALGIGIQGMADVFMLLDMAWDSEEAAKLESKIYEHVYYYALKASNELAKEKGLVYEGFEGSDFSKGILQFDHWNKVEFTIPVEKWNALKESIKEHGIANSLLTTQMPNALSSHVSGSQEGFQPINSNLYVRSVEQGDFKIVSPYLQKDLEKYGLWSEWFRTQLIEKEGSIQDISFNEFILQGSITPQEVSFLKQKHKTIFEVKLSDQIKRSRNRAPWIDQTQSFNLHLAKPDLNILAKALWLAFELDLKTLCYYVKSTAVSTADKSLAVSLDPVVKPQQGPACDGCEV